MTTATNFGVQINQDLRLVQIGDYVLDDTGRGHPENGRDFARALVYYDQSNQQVTIRWGISGEFVYKQVYAFVNLGDDDYLMYITGRRYAKILMFR